MSSYDMRGLGPTPSTASYSATSAPHAPMVLTPLHPTVALHTTRSRQVKPIVAETVNQVSSAALGA